MTKFSSLVLTAVLALATHFTPSLAQDRANLARYARDNGLLVSPMEGENRVVFMGDSITEGWSNILPEFFEGNPYINRGISGQTTSQMLLRFRQDVIDLDPAVVVILAGTNDIAENQGPITLDAIAGNLMSMCELARANGINVVLSSVLPAKDYPWRPGLGPDKKIPALNEMLARYAEESGVTYLDYFRQMTDGENGMIAEYTSDGVHVTELGYRVMGRLVQEAIAASLPETN